MWVLRENQEMRETRDQLEMWVIQDPPESRDLPEQLDQE